MATYTSSESVFQDITCPNKNLEFGFSRGKEASDYTYISKIYYSP